MGGFHHAQDKTHELQSNSMGVRLPSVGFGQGTSYLPSYFAAA